MDVLEHIPELVTAMTNCLILLAEGGIMKISSPYDLSLGGLAGPDAPSGVQRELVPLLL